MVSEASGREMVRRAEASTTPSTRDRAVARVLWGVLFLNLGVATTKLVVGFSIGALSLLADGVHSLLDGASNVVGIVGIAVAARPADAGHPYGHRRFETVAAALIGLLIAAGLFEIARTVISALFQGHRAPEVNSAAVVAVIATIVTNIVISWYERKRGRELRSVLLQADAAHTMSDALGAAAVLSSFVAVELGFGWADVVAACVVSILIGRTAWGILRANLSVLTDSARLDPHEVHRVALSVPGVRGAHRIRSRGSSEHVHLDLHIHMDPDLSLAEAHRKTHEAIDALRAAFPEVHDVVIHTEPADGREHDLTSITPGKK